MTFDSVKSSLFVYSGHELHGDGGEGIQQLCPRPGRRDLTSGSTGPRSYE